MSPSMIEARAAVAAGTLAAVHRRDHQHDADCCTPHCVEVVHLGDRAVMVCHDCATDSGFIVAKEAEVLAREHVHSSATQADPELGDAVPSTSRVA